MVQFTLKQLFVAMACFAVAFAIAARIVLLIQFLHNPPADVEGPSLFLAVSSIPIYWLVLSVSMGAGVGRLCKNVGSGIQVGVVIGFISFLFGGLLLGNSLR